MTEPKKRQRRSPSKASQAQAKPVEPVETQVEKTEEEIPINKYAPKDKLGKPLLGRSPNYVTSVGLGKLNVVHAKGVKDNGNS